MQTPLVSMPDCVIKGSVYPKNVIHYLLTILWMESLVKFLTPQNISGAPQHNSVETFFYTTEVHMFEKKT